MKARSARALTPTLRTSDRARTARALWCARRTPEVRASAIPEVHRGSRDVRDGRPIGSAIRSSRRLKFWESLSGYAAAGDRLAPTSAAVYRESRTTATRFDPIAPVASGGDSAQGRARQASDAQASRHAHHSVTWLTADSSSNEAKVCCARLAQPNTPRNPLAGTRRAPDMLTHFALIVALTAPGRLAPADSIRGDAEIRVTAMRHVADVRRCYQREGLARDPNLSGTMDVTVTVVPTGAVRRAEVTAHAMRGHGAREVAACLTAAIRNWRFERGPFQVETIIFPFAFTPETAIQPKIVITG